MVCADRDEAGVKATAEACGGTAFVTDVSKEADIVALIEATERDIGPIDLFCSNAGIGVGGGGRGLPTPPWRRGSPGTSTSAARTSGRPAISSR